jgi:hypothetical protein
VCMGEVKQMHLKSYSLWTSGGGSTFSVFRRSICSTACRRETS